MQRLEACLRIRICPPEIRNQRIHTRPPFSITPRSQCTRSLRIGLLQVVLHVTIPGSVEIDAWVWYGIVGLSSCTLGTLIVITDANGPLLCQTMGPEAVKGDGAV